MNVIRPLFSWMLLPFSSNAGISRALLYLDLVDPTFSPISMLMSIIKRLIIIPFFLLVRKKLNTTNEYMKGLLNFYLFGNLITLVFINGFAPIQRLASPFLYMEIFIIPALLKTVKNTYIKYLVLMLMVLYGLLKLYVLINGPYKDLYTPYYSVFDRVTREAYSHYK
ncbi:hypothetical protein AGMMS49546_37810 [Spirochaetia bacterium]|nr:hypothetical protein AGMMS49546_37810 [Spirochaetia bacterium]